MGDRKGSSFTGQGSDHLRSRLAGASAGEVNERLAWFESTFAEWFLKDPVEVYNEAAGRLVDGHNAWLREQQQAHDRGRQLAEQATGKVHELAGRLDRLKADIDRLRPAADSSEEVQALNRVVEEYNGVVGEYRLAVDECNRLVRAANDAVRETSEESQRQRAAVDQELGRLKAQAEEYGEWVRSQGPEKYWTDLNRLYAMLAGRVAGGTDARWAGGCMPRLRALRRGVAEQALAGHQRAAFKLLFTRACIGGEECLVMVDNGASVSAITPEMADVLGLVRGDEVEISLPDGIRIKAPQVVLPEVRVGESVAELVAGVVLRESAWGVDGSLGMSFLSRFDFAISPQGLTLHGREARPSGRQFDVFISYRSVDSGHAQAVYDVLVGAGHRPFFALASVPGGGRADFGRAIDEAIEEVEHMVVVCSSRENVEAPWVDREWRFYEHLVTSGRKPRGNVVPVLCGGMRPEDLPGPLSRYHAVSLGAPRWQADLLSFVQAR